MSYPIGKYHFHLILFRQHQLSSGKEKNLSNDINLEETIRENASGPKRAQGDSGSIEQHSLKDQIDADKYLASKKAVKHGIGIKNVKISPDGTT